ncbi:hypothetical protein FHG87_015725 [Trinorchestia longiramus]|nr:hypothetical protein FHG87_015725 [Trinorchestia longiramus]
MIDSSLLGSNSKFTNKAEASSRLLRCRISSVKECRIWLAELLLGEELLDTTDGKMLRSRISLDSDSYRRYGVEQRRKFPKDVRYSVHAEFRQSPLPEISRSDEGKFILDKDSEEGGFASPRRPTRGLRGYRNFREWTSPPEAGWTNAVSGIESGVYRVRQGTTHFHSAAPEPPLLTMRSDGSGASTYELPRNTFRSPVIYENSLVARNSHRSPYVVQPSSPQFGKHIIPQSPTGPVLSPKGRLRSSSPGPLSTQWRQLAQLASFNEVSSVKQPSSVERSFPSTLISSFHNSNQLTPSMRGFPGDGISPFFQFSSYSPYGKELPVLSPLYRYPDSRTIHVVGAQVHEPPPRFCSRPTYHPYYLPTPRYSPWGTPQGAYYDRRFDWMSPHQAEMMGRRAVLDSGQHVHQLPQHRIISPYNRAHHDSARHYANLPPMISPRGFQQQPSPLRVPHFLLNPLPRPENQKPLATSSPPRLRMRTRGYERDMHPSVHAVSRLPRVVPDYENRNLRSDRGAKGLMSTVGEHPESRRRQGSGRIRHHSAPDLNTSSRDFKDNPTRSRLHHGRPRRHGDRSRSHEVSYDLSPEFSHDQSPDSSSGFGSKNTSQQQSSSQSGQSLAALGLDTSRFSENSIKAFAPSDQRWESRRLGIGAQIWPPPRLPPSYEQWLARQMQPQFRVPSGHYSYAIGDENRDFMLSRRTNPSVIPRHSLREVAHSHPNVNELENDVFDSVDQVDRTATTTATPVANLDVSVDDHYEFDTMLSPTPIDETLMPGSSEWSSVGSAGNGNSLRRLSDSELYGTGSSFGDRRRMSEESMEERVAAMKQEFMEYRRRQARRSETQLESVC